MKNIKYILSVFVFATLLFSCEEITQKPSITDGTAPVLSRPDGSLDYTFTEENATSPFETFVYTAADYGTSIITNYTIEVDNVDGDWSTKFDMQGASNKLYQSISIKDFNLLLGSTGIGLTPEEQGMVKVRVRADAAHDSVRTHYSNSFELKVTPYDATIPPLYAVGSGTEAGWTPANGIEITAIGVGIYEDIIKLTPNPDEFRFLGQNTGWGPDGYFFDSFSIVESIPTNSVGAAPSNEFGEINFWASEAGDYLVTINTNNKSIKFVKQ